MVLIKDNHIRAAGGITAAIESARLGSPVPGDYSFATGDRAGKKM